MSVSTAARPTSHELIRFLLARVDEDETQLKRLARAHAEIADTGDGVRAIGRLRAETEAKRRLIGSLQQLLVLRDQPSEKPVRDQAAQMLRTMAAPYDGHASYRAEWRH